MPIPENQQLPLQGFLYSPDAPEAASDIQVPLRVPENIPDYEIQNITEAIANGEAYLYNKQLGNVYKYAKDSAGNIYEFRGLDASPYYNNQYLTPISFSEVRKKLPPRAFVGGNTVEQARINMIKRIPGFTESVWKKAQTYGVDPNLILRRFIKEGFADQLIRIYNGSSAANQTDFQKNPDLYLPLSGYGSLGLDYVGDELAKGLYKLKDSTATWEDYGSWEDNEGSDGHRTGKHSVSPNDLNSAIEMMAAAMAYRQGLMRERYGVSGSDLNIYTNAAYNMGPYHEDLGNADYIKRTYAYPDYYSKYGLSYSEGGKLKTENRAKYLAEMLHEKGYTVDSLKAAVGRRFDDGGQTPPDTMADDNAISDAERGLSEWREQHYGANQATKDLFLKPVGNILADELYRTEYEGYTPDEVYDKVEARGFSLADTTYASRIQLEKDILNLKNARAHSAGDRYIPGTKLRNPLFLADPAVEEGTNAILQYYNTGVPANVYRKPKGDMGMGTLYGYFSSPFDISIVDTNEEDPLYHEYSHLMDDALSRRVQDWRTVNGGSTDAGARFLLPHETQNFLYGLTSNNSYYEYVRNPTEVVARLHDFRRRNGIDINRRDFTGNDIKTGNYIHDITFTQLVDAFNGDYDALAKALNETYAEGGPLDKEPVQKPQIDTVRLRQLVDRINRTSNADFVKRLLDKNRKVLDNGGGSVSTHELSYATDGEGNAVVFPEVQSDDAGFLNRYPWPLSYDRAVQRGDTLMMSVPDAELFTNNNYKMMYPGFDKYAGGGHLLSESDEPLVLPEVVVTPNGNYVNYTGSESNKPTPQEFLETRAGGARVRAVNNMLNTEHPVVPAVPSKLARYAIRLGVPENRAIKLFGYANSPHTCIATTTRQFDDPEAYVPGNITFDTNRTGFMQVGDYDYQPGDLINLYEAGVPYHSTMVTGIVGDSVQPYTLLPILTYSNGGIDRGDNLSMRYNKNNLYNDDDESTPDFGVGSDNLGKNTYKVFRYVGSPSMLFNWMDEYRRLYSPIGEARNPGSRQSIIGYKFETMPDGKLRVVRGK